MMLIVTFNIVSFCRSSSLLPFSLSSYFFSAVSTRMCTVLLAIIVVVSYCAEHCQCRRYTDVKEDRKALERDSDYDMSTYQRSTESRSTTKQLSTMGGLMCV